MQQFWDQGSKFNVEMWDQVEEDIPRYDPGSWYSLVCGISKLEELPLLNYLYQEPITGIIDFVSE